MIVIADLHLGRTSDSVYDENGYPSRFSDSATRLEEARIVAMEKGHSIVVAGDVFDRINPTVQALKLFFDWVRDCNEDGVAVHIIPGNHDASVALTNVDMMGALNYLAYPRPTVAEIDGYMVGMAPHLSRRNRESLLAEQSYSEYLRDKFSGKCNLIIGHGQVVGSDYQNDIFFEAAEAMEFDAKVLSGFEVILGHIHNRSTYGNVKYPGSLLVHNYGEVDDKKGYFVVSGENATCKWKPWESEVHEYRMIEVDLTQPKELDEDVIAENAEGALLKIVYRLNRDNPVDTHALTNLFNKYGTVTRVSTVVEEFEEKRAKKKLDVSHNHTELLKGWLKGVNLSVKDQNRVLKLGVEIMEEVLGD